MRKIKRSPSPRSTPRYWLARAEEVKTLADGMRSRSAREAMLRVADDYERQAELARQRSFRRADLRMLVWRTDR
jgi:hypothetical protein